MGDNYSYAPADKMTAAYIKIRQKRAELSAEFKRQDDELSGQLDVLKRALLGYCHRNKVESVRTKEGLFFRQKKIKYWTSDWEAFHKFIVEQSIPELLDRRLNQTNMRQFLEENPDIERPSGLKIDEEYVISVRKK